MANGAREPNRGEVADIKMQALTIGNPDRKDRSRTLGLRNL
jgi:hypothetical protein